MNFNYEFAKKGTDFSKIFKRNKKYSDTKF